MTAFSGIGYYQIQSGKFFYFDGNTTIGDIRFRGTGTVKWLSGTIKSTASPLRVVNTLTLNLANGGFSNGSKVYVGGSFASNYTTQPGTYETLS